MCQCCAERRDTNATRRWRRLIPVVFFFLSSFPVISHSSPPLPSSSVPPSLPLSFSLLSFLMSLFHLA